MKFFPKILPIIKIAASTPAKTVDLSIIKMGSCRMRVADANMTMKMKDIKSSFSTFLNIRSE